MRLVGSFVCIFFGRANTVVINLRGLQGDSVSNIGDCILLAASNQSLLCNSILPNTCISICFRTKKKLKHFYKARVFKNLWLVSIGLHWCVTLLFTCNLIGSSSSRCPVRVGRSSQESKSCKVIYLHWCDTYNKYKTHSLVLLNNRDNFITWASFSCRLRKQQFIN